ncbi:unnamed protein product [Calypogeia fissa]
MANYTIEEKAERKEAGLHFNDNRWAFGRWYDSKGNLVTVEPTPDNPIPYLSGYSHEPDYEPYVPRQYLEPPQDELDDVFDEMKEHLKETAKQEKMKEEKRIQEEEKRQKQQIESEQRQVEANCIPAPQQRLQRRRPFPLPPTSTPTPTRLPRNRL